MSSIPSNPTPGSSAGQVLRTIDPGPTDAPAAPVAPPRETPPPGPGLPGLPNIPASGPASAVAPKAGPMPTGPVNEEGVVFLSDEEFAQDLLKEDYTLPLAVFAVAGLGFLVSSALFGMNYGGTSGALGLAIVGFITLAAMVTTGTIAAWIVGRIFALDVGSFGPLLLRVSATMSAVALAQGSVTMFLGPWIGVLLALPVMLICTTWLLGMNLLQAIVFAVMNGLVWFMLVSFFLLGLVTQYVSV